MKLRNISVMLILALCLSLVPLSAFAATSAVSLNDVASIEQGGSVTISGTSTLNEVIIQVLRPGNAGTVFYDITKVSEGQFTSSFTLRGSEPAGTYKIIAGQGNQVASQDLVVTASPVVTPPGPPIGSVITGPGEELSSGNLVTPPNTRAVVVQVDARNNVVQKNTAANGHVTNAVTQDDAALAAALSTAAGQDNQGDAPIVAIAFNNPAGESVVFNVSSSVLAAAAANAPNTVISFQTNDGEYSMPIRIMDYAALAQSLGTTIAGLKIQIKIANAETAINASINASAQQMAASQVGSAIEYSLYAAGNGQTVEINNFGTTYVERSIVRAIPTGADTATVVLYEPDTGEFSFVPAVFAEQADGTYTITFKRNGNSIYTLLSSTKTFSDVNMHWAKEDIELLASKLVVNGVSDTSFAPNNNITRAEFAALLVRSLGLKANASAAAFQDVRSSDWFAGAVGAAVEAKLVAGFNDNSFKPNAPITREQMAVMVSNAIRAAGKTADASASDALSKFNDQASISSWAQAAVAQAVEANIITGMTDATFVPSANASRAQAVVMLKRLLQYSDFIN
ncbi:S-layer homology domain-containing protein [Paenibacillus sp. sgz302251]|uniref:S-layer homology domain-containing protein n=1 Tax=Paenibacillus sp. sgz302251 TaxID=3414493 RepID=UPI003C7D6C42